MRLGALAVTIGLASALMSRGADAAILFDFEGLSTGDYSSLAQTAGGLTLTLTRPGSSFGIADTGVAAFGSRSLSPLPSSGSNTPFLVNFSQGISALSFQSGDFNPDDDVIRLNLYSGLDGTGTLVGSTTVNYDGTKSLPGEVATTSYSGSIFQSAVFIGGSSSFPNSVYYDNFVATVSTVPLPASAPMFGAALLGLAGLGYTAKRRAPTAA